jgi:hypothetical protein
VEDYLGLQKRFKHLGAAERKLIAAERDREWADMRQKWGF